MGGAVTTPYLIPDLKSDEGFRAHAYPDPLSGGEPYTVGYGATGYVIGPNTVWTEAEADADLEQRVGMLCAQLNKALPWFKSLADARQDVLVNMGYNLGLAGLLGFHNTLTFIQAQDWQGAHDNMLASLWAKQVPNRAKRLAEQMLTGLVASVIRPVETIVTDTGPVAAQPAPTPPVAAPAPDTGNVTVATGAGAIAAQMLAASGAASAYGVAQLQQGAAQMAQPVPTAPAIPTFAETFMQSMAQKVWTIAATAVGASVGFTSSQQQQFVALGVSATMFGVSILWTYIKAKLDTTRQVQLANSAPASPPVKH